MPKTEERLMATPSAMRMKVIAGQPADGLRVGWQLEGMVRGERVQAQLFATESDEAARGLTVWIHGGTDPEAESPISSSSRRGALLELHWPHLGPRRDAKLSPLLTKCLTETVASQTLDAVWKRFAEQAALEVFASLTAVRAQRELRIGMSTQLHLDLRLPGTQPITASWGPASKTAENWSQQVRSFLEALRSPHPA